MRHATTAIAVALAFSAGLIVSPLTRFAPRDAHSEAAALTPIVRNA